MHLRPSALVAAGVVAVVTSAAGCTSSSGDTRPTGDRTTPVVTRPASAPPTSTFPTSAFPTGATAAGPSAAVLGRPAGPCKVALPAAWSAALRSGRLWSGRDATHATGVPDPDGRAVLAEDDTPTTSTVSLRGPGRADLRTVATIARVHGQGSMGDSAADASHLAFVYSTVDGQGAQNHWRLYLAGATGPARVVATDPQDASGQALAGGYVHPLLTSTALFWIQAAQNAVGSRIGSAGSALMRYDLVSGRTSVVYSGLATSLVALGGQVLVTAVGADLTPGAGGNPPLVVRAFDATTGRAVAAPAGLAAGADDPDWLVSDGDLVAWNTADGAIRAWRAAWGRSITVVPRFDTWPLAARNSPPIDYPGYPRLLGHFLAWNATATFVLDLRTDSFVQLTAHHGALEAAGDRLAMWQYTKDAPPVPGAGLVTDQWVLDLAGLPGLPGC